MQESDRPITTSLTWMRYIFEITYDDGSTKSVKGCNTNRGAAWAILCRDISKRDHGDVRKISSVRFV